MKPSEPVTRTVLPATEPSTGRGVSSAAGTSTVVVCPEGVVTAAFSSSYVLVCRQPRRDRSRLALRASEVLRGADVDPLALDRPDRDRLAALEAPLDQARHRAGPPGGQPGERARLDGIHRGVDVEAQRRLLRDAGDASVGALDDAEGHLVLVGARRDGHGGARAPVRLEEVA